MAKQFCSKERDLGKQMDLSAAAECSVFLDIRGESVVFLWFKSGVDLATDTHTDIFAC
jgi:hypothetical protein